MPDGAAIAQFERRLAELDCPAARLREKVRELADHHEDLKQAGLEEGLSEAEAEAQANRQLGEPVLIAEQVAATLRQSFWCGRHRILAFCLLPPIATFVMVGATLAADFIAGHLYFPPALFSIIADQPDGLKLLQFVLTYSAYGAIALTAILFCRMAGWSASGLKCKLAACAICSLYCYFVGLTVEPHTLAYGINFPPGMPRDWIPVILPLLVCVVVIARHRWRVRQLAPIPSPGPPGSRLIRPKPAMLRSSELTPTTILAALAVIGLVGAIRYVRADVLKQRARREELITRIWPAERAEVVRQLKSHALMGRMADATTISLKPYVNAALGDSLGGPRDTNENDLRQIPSGVHLYAGVPFDVEGRVQLLGQSLLNTAPTLPLHVSNIRVGTRCDRIFLLHGASGIKPEMSGRKVAGLVVHYSDGSRAAIPIVAGEQLLDWWGPLYQTAADPRTTAPASHDTELAWIGSNPAIRRGEPDYSLRVYRSVFANPHPELVVSAIDYISTASDGSPFLLGLTVQ